MRRFQLFEWEDQPWLPRVFRDFITDHLTYTHNQQMREPVNEAVADLLLELLTTTGATRIIDLCSGAGGPLRQIARILIERGPADLEIQVTDRYPNVEAFRKLEATSSGRIRARYDSVSATDVPAELHGVRTLFTALHHFHPSEAAKVLGDAVAKAEPIAVFEFLERTPRMVTLVGLMSFIRGLTHTPIVGRLTLGRVVATYLVPVAPVLFAWDGAVSCLRTYTPEELLRLAGGIESPDYSWRAGRFDVSGPYGEMPTVYLLGSPAKRS